MSEPIVITVEPLEAVCERTPNGWWHVLIRWKECGSLVEEHVVENLDNIECLIEDECDKLNEAWVRFGP